MRYLDVGTVKKISKIGLGTWQFGAEEWGYGKPYAEQEASAIVRRGLQLGVTFFDTAEIYGAGRSERILGRALGEDRESVFVATKIFPIVPVVPLVRQRAVASAKRLGVPRLDLYQSHWPNPLVRDSTLMRGMRSMQQAGLVGEVGVSNYSLRHWRAAEDALGTRILTNQVGYSLVDRSPELELLPFAESHDHVIIAFSPLAQGLLSGRYHGTGQSLNRVRGASPLFHPESIARTSDLIAVLREVAEAHSATPAQIALAWAIHSPAVVAIPGASSVAQLESNVAAAEIELANDEYQALCTASAWSRPAAARDASPDRNLPALKHSARGTWYVAKTMRHDFELRRAGKVTHPLPASAPQTKSDHCGLGNPMEALPEAEGCDPSRKDRSRGATTSASKSRRNRSLAELAAINRAGSESSRSISTAAALDGSSSDQNRASTPSSQSSEIGPMLPATMGRPAPIASMIASDDDSE
jgi:aryl-alcohol dehydrogenase-like predicted oxidoreductase